MKLIRFLLFPFAVLYDGITRFRNFLFDKNILKSTSFDTPIIAVGNLSVGGTGKTPQIEYLIRLLKNNYNIAVLSRGYKRKTKGFILADKNVTAEDIGDEPLQFFKKFDDISVAVDADRTNGIQNLLQEKQPDVILLDDAYQHRKVKAGYYILLTKYNDLYSNDFLLPTGYLRESKKGAKRANTIIVTKCPKNLSNKEQENIKKRLKIKQNQSLFFTTIAYNKVLKGVQSKDINDLKNQEFVLVTGIANPNPLLEYLNTKNLNFIHIPFPDHHHFSNKDLEKIKGVFENIKSEGKVILTTEKDYVRLENKLDDLYYLEIKSEFLDKNEEFNTEIQNFIKR